MYDEMLQNRLSEWMKRKGLSQAKVANMLGVSQTALSQYRNSKYERGNIEEIESKIKELLKIEEEKEVSKQRNYQFRADGYIPTSISEDVYKLIQYCHFEKGMVVVHGDAGIGKTKGAEKYFKENSNSTIYIQATPSSGTLGNLLKLIARALKINEKQNKLDLILSIQEKLEGSNKVIIIDEAQHLKLQALEEIRSLSDKNDITGSKGTGIVLIGNTEVYSKMLGKQEAKFAQLFSRIKLNKYYNTKKIKKEDIQKLFSAVDDDEMISFLYGISQSKWGIRGAVNVYNNALSNDNLTKSGLKDMALTMGIGITR